MPSGRIRTPALAIGEEAFDPGYPVGQPVDVPAQRLDLGILPRQVLPPPALSRARRCVVGDEHAAALIRLHKLLAAQNADRVVNGHRRDTVPAGQLPPGRKPLAGLVRPGGDARAQVVGDLKVRRPGVVRVGLHPSRVCRPRSLGRTRRAQSACPGLPRCLSCNRTL